LGWKCIQFPNLLEDLGQHLLTPGIFDVNTIGKSNEVPGLITPFVKLKKNR
jgi:hypothetical protein